MMANNIEIPKEDIQHYAELDLSQRRGYNYDKHAVEEGFEAYDDTDLCIPANLSDQDKFISALIHLHYQDRGLTTRRLTEWFGWSKYKCYKLAKENKYCRTVTLVCEEGGYGGKGWMIGQDMFDAMRKYRKQNYHWADCKNMVSLENDTYFPSRSKMIGYCKFSSQYSCFEDSGCRTGKFEK